MLKPFALHTPDTVAQALELLWQHEDAKVVAGGTDVFIEMHNGVSHAMLIDLKGLDKLRCATFDEAEGLTIGALATMRELIRNADVRKYYPALLDALSTVGSVQVRSKATIAGNICNASPAADSAGPLLLYDAVVRIRSREGERDVPIAEFFTGPKKNCLKKGEIVTQIMLAPPMRGSGSGYSKLKKRGAMEIGIVGAGVRLAADAANRCTLARFSLSAVNPTPVRVRKAEEFLVGRELNGENLQAAVDFAYETAAPLTWRNSEEWSKDMVRVFLRQSIERALDRREKGGY